MDDFEPWKFAAGIVVGIIIFQVCQWLYYRWRERRDRKQVQK